MITLVIVDCQNDFITGTMSVKGAKNTVEEIKKFIKKHKEEIEKIIFTLDWHPYNHSSFKKYGGMWPSHCVQHTPGACIEPKLLKLVQSLEMDFEFSLRGEIEEIEQLGAFSEIEYVQDCLGSRYYFDSIVTADANTNFIICGICNAVSSTISNMLKEDIVPTVFMPGIIPNNTAFNEFVELNKLEKIV